MAQNIQGKVPKDINDRKLIADLAADILRSNNPIPWNFVNPFVYIAGSSFSGDRRNNLSGLWSPIQVALTDLITRPTLAGLKSALAMVSITQASLGLLVDVFNPSWCTDADIPEVRESVIRGMAEFWDFGSVEELMKGLVLDYDELRKANKIYEAAHNISVTGVLSDKSVSRLLMMDILHLMFLYILLITHGSLFYVRDGQGLCIVHVSSYM